VVKEVDGTLKPGDVHTDTQKVEKMIEQAVEISELKSEIKALKVAIEEMRLWVLKVQAVASELQTSLLQFRLEAQKEKGQKPSWAVTIVLTILTGLVSALGVYVLIRQ